jgi:uncharacterized membrane protein YbjE (DUF340 family)
MSIWEIIMLLCFGSAWPFSIYKSWKSRTSAGKSIIFLYVVVAGYAAGVVHKLYNNFDRVTYLYAFNALIVTVDIILYYRNKRLEKNATDKI